MSEIVENFKLVCVLSSTSDPEKTELRSFGADRHWRGRTYVPYEWAEYPASAPAFVFRTLNAVEYFLSCMDIILEREQRFQLWRCESRADTVTALDTELVALISGRDSLRIYYNQAMQEENHDKPLLEYLRERYRNRMRSMTSSVTCQLPPIGTDLVTSLRLVEPATLEDL